MVWRDAACPGPARTRPSTAFVAVDQHRDVARRDPRRRAGTFSPRARDTSAHARPDARSACPNRLVVRELIGYPPPAFSLLPHPTSAPSILPHPPDALATNQCRLDGYLLKRDDLRLKLLLTACLDAGRLAPDLSQAVLGRAASGRVPRCLAIRRFGRHNSCTQREGPAR